MKGRLLSLDVLRGADMFFIMGGEWLVCTIAALLGDPNFNAKFNHVPWHGLQFMDTVFPLFLFLAGVSFPFSAAKSLEKGATRAQVALKALRRGLTLFALGLLYGGFLNLDFAHFRVWSVLGRIGLAWMFAAWLYLAFGTRVRLILVAAVLAGVTVFTILVPAPGAAAGVDPFSAAGNFGCWLDRTLTAGHIACADYDPEGFAGILPAVVTALLGMFAGEIVRKGGTSATDAKALRLLFCGIGCAALGFALSPVCPINKALWSPSFTLVVGGWSFAVFALFYWIIDVKVFDRWAFFFTVIGMNSITIYLGQAIVNFTAIDHFFLKGLAGLLPALWGRMLLEVGYIAICWLFLHFLYRHKVFLKV